VVKTVAFGKDLVVASAFGASGVMDAFLIAYLAPALAIYLLGSVPDALIPVYLRMRGEASPREVSRFLENFLGRYLVVLVVGLTCLAAFSGPMVGFLARKLAPEHRELAVALSRWLLPFVFFDALCQIWANLLQAHRKFALAAVSPAAIPLCVLGALVLGGARWGVGAMVAGTLAGSVLQAVVLARASRNVSRIGWPRWDRGGVDGGRLVRIALPLVAAEALVAVSSFVDGAMASQLGTGSVSTLTFAEKIFSVVVMLATTALSQVLFPTFSEFAARGRIRELRAFFVRFGAGLSVAAVVAGGGMALVAEPLVRAMFERGAFGPEDTERVAAVLRFCVPQLPFLVIGVMANRALVSLERGHLLIGVTVLTCLANGILNWLFIRWFGLPGIPLSTAAVYLISAAAGTFLLFRATSGRP
jgi:putative peptidoglycan lipid II flippase